MKLHDYLRQRVIGDGLPTEDVLVAFLPLVRQVADTHDCGAVAPLEGLNDLHVADGAIVFHKEDTRPLRRNLRKIKSVGALSNAGVEVTGEHHVTFDVHSGVEEHKSLQVVDDAAEAQPRPSYLRGYVCWEHLAEHHDPTTDIFSLGLILASLACGLDLADIHDHDRFVKHRRNLFQVQSSLHPVIARTIELMTELQRRDRPQDLLALCQTLENYRDQDVDFETDLLSDQSDSPADLPGRRQVILSKLQERLFEINRRNRLLHFRWTMQTINLTLSSIPVSFEPARIRDDQVLTWNGDFAKALSKQRPVVLNRYLNFREAIYLPGQLDRLRIESRRDETEYGFAQLRLIVCFLRWADLKTNPPEQYESPLLLIPVKLDVRKGIHDRFSVTATNDVAEVNPLIRHMFRQLYDIDLPTEVELSVQAVESFYEELKKKIQTSDKSVTLECVRKPKIELIHQKAQRRLEQFQRRARLSGRGIRRYLDLDYSYDPMNYHPLGVSVFEAFLAPTHLNLDGVVTTQQPHRRYMVQAGDDKSHDGKPHEGEVVEAEKTFYRIQDQTDSNPYHWEFDLCGVTLANLKYRRMSLVRDYTQLVDENSENAAFEETFSITAPERPVATHTNGPLQDRYPVVACDPTQTEAIDFARSGRSYIVQGPPGTGKSQTITNLIADYIMRGQRVLFVCEKRAAIDVVYNRLKQLGLQELCCLIHDSQADKKQFVMDLKDTYDRFLAEQKRPRDQMLRRRTKIVDKIEKSLRPIRLFYEAMTRSEHDEPTLRDLLDRLLQLQNHTVNFAPTEWERVPSYVDFSTHRESIDEFERRLVRLQPDRVLFHHPLCLLSERLVHVERPVERVNECLSDCLGESVVGLSHSADDNGILNRLIGFVEKLKLPVEMVSSLQQLRDLITFACDAGFLTDSNQLQLLDKKSKPSKAYNKHLKKLKRCDKQLAKARKATGHWRTKFSPEETHVALQQAKRFEHDWLRVFKPGWWRLRRAMKSAYDFSGHAIQPLWSHVLTHLSEEHSIVASCNEIKEEIREEFAVAAEFDAFDKNLQSFKKVIESLPEHLGKFYQYTMSRDDPAGLISKVARLKSSVGDLTTTLDRCLEEYQLSSLADLKVSLVSVSATIEELPDFLHCLRTLQSLPPHVKAAFRTLPVTPRQLEAAAAEKSLQAAYRADHELALFNHDVRLERLQHIRSAGADWLIANAAAIRESVRQRFTDNVTTASLPAAQLTAEQKEFKKTYNRGRREVEHEFGKSMRYKSIRELASGDPGCVVRDLKPVWLMSPLSVSDTLPLNAHHFDVVIFDEASQITLEEAIPSLFRANQTIVVGDEMQLPPTSFFSSRSHDEDGELAFEEDGEVVHYNLNSSSFLNHTSRNLPSRLLGWHYRSRSESLISFSNHAFYAGRLLTVPEERRAADVQKELVAASAEDGSLFANEILQRPVSFHFCSHGVYEKRRNTAEAEYIAELVRQLLSGEHTFSIGIIAFSEAQQAEIDDALRRLAESDAEFSDRLDAEKERVDDGQFMGLLVRNLENIQGDERDVIIMSVCYGPNSEGRVRMNFGPVNQAGGEKRLNVAFSRARHCMALVSSMRSSTITNDYNDGANCLKNYLRYAEACSISDHETAVSVIRSMSGSRRLDDAFTRTNNVLCEQIVVEILKHGYCVDRDIGQSHFRCDIAVYREGDKKFRLGILVDGSAWYRQQDHLEREVSRPDLLEAFGWHVEVVLAIDWYNDPDAVTQRLLSRLDDIDHEIVS